MSDRAAAAGLFETINYPFVDRESDEAAWSEWLGRTGTAAEPLAIANPLDASRRHLRATLLPGLLDAVARNLRHGAPEVALFEVGRAFGDAGEPDRPESYESRRLAFALAGAQRSHWSVPEKLRAADFFDAKGLVEALLRDWLAPSELVWKPVRVAAFTEGAAATAQTRSGTLVAIAGLVSGAERERRALSAPVFAGEILVGAIPAGSRPFRFAPYSDLPAIVADLSLTQPKTLSWDELSSFVRGSRPRAPRIRVVPRPVRGPGRAVRCREDDAAFDVPLGGANPRTGRSQPGSAEARRGARLAARRRGGRSLGRKKEGRMDTVKVFDNLDRRIEKLIGRLKQLETDNEKLRSDLAASRKAEKDAGESRGSVERLEREQEVVRERLEKLIRALEAAEEKKS